MIDEYVDTNMALDIPLLINRPGQKTITEKQTYSSGGKTLTRNVNRTFSFVYDNYFFGKKASQITSASDCSLVRGSEFGGFNTKVEMNHGYTMIDAANDSKKINQDGAANINCKQPTQSYWGGNSPLNSKYANGEVTLGPHRYDDFSEPILDLSGGKTTTLGVGNALDCTKRDLLLEPYKYTSIDGKTLYPWPVETRGSRYSCATDFAGTTPYPINLDPSPEGSENILTSLISCPPDPKSITNVTLLDRKGGTMTTCQTNGPTGVYRRISSLIKHADPSRDVYGQELQGISAPNVPVDEKRTLSFIDRNAQPISLIYPNLFNVAVAPSDTDEVIISKIKTLLDASNNQLSPGRIIPDNHPWKFLVGSSQSAPKLSDIILQNPDIKAGLVDSLRWKSLNIEAKYARAFDLSLSTQKTE